MEVFELNNHVGEIGVHLLHEDFDISLQRTQVQISTQFGNSEVIGLTSASSSFIRR